MPITPDSALKNWIDITPANGINAEDPTGGVLTEDTYVSDSENFEFHHGAAFTRPGITFISPTPALETLPGGAYDQDAWSQLMTGALSYGDSSTPVIATVARKGATKTMWRFTFASPTSWLIVPILENAVGAPHPLPDPANVMTWDFVNGDLVFAGIGDLEDLVQVTAGSGPYQSITDTAHWDYPVSHVSRLVAGNSLANSTAVGWSVAGNATSWNTYGGNSAGVILADGLDSITGMANIRDTIVVFRATGITLMRPTRQASLAFENERFEKNGIGCYHVGTLAASRSIAIFGGEDNIYSFDLNNIVPIGDKAGRSILDMWYSNGTVRSLIVHNCGRRRSSYYITHLNDLNPTWAYNLQHSTWSKFTFDDPPRHFSSVPYPNRVSNMRSLVGYAPNTPWPTTSLNGAFWIMSAGVACERASYIVSRTFIVGAPMEEYRCSRAIVIHTTTTSAQITVTVECRTQGGVATSVATPTTSANATTKPDRLIVPFTSPVTGNWFSVRVDYPANTEVTLFKILLEFDRVGGLRASV